MHSTWRTIAGVKEYKVEAGCKIGAIVDKWLRSGYAIGRRKADVTEEWAPELGRADDAVAKWSGKGFKKCWQLSRIPGRR